jgi:hypothetical protein
MLQLYNIFGKFISLENFEENEPDIIQDNIDTNVYAYLILENGKSRLTLYPYYMNDDMAKNGEFYLSKSRNNITLKLISEKSDEKDLASTELKSKNNTDLLVFRINNNNLEIKKNNYFKIVGLSKDKKLQIIDNKTTVNKFLFYPNNSIINIVNNKPEATFYKINISRDMFYLKSSLEDNKYITINGCDTTNKNEAAIFSLIEGNNFKLKTLPLPEEEKVDNKVINIDAINRIKIYNLKIMKAKKYNLILIEKNKNIIKRFGLKLLNDNIRNKPSFVKDDVDIYDKNYNLNLWI